MIDLTIRRDFLRYIYVGGSLGVAATLLLHLSLIRLHLAGIQYSILVACLYLVFGTIGYFAHRRYSFGIQTDVSHRQSPLRFTCATALAALLTAVIASFLESSIWLTQAAGTYGAALAFSAAAFVVSLACFSVCKWWVFALNQKHSSLNSSLKLELCAVGLVGAISFVVWTLFTGRDLNWDFINYHLYLGFAADGSRLTQDFFPANIQSYLAPYAYWPIAKMIVSQWPGWMVGAGLAIIQSFSVVATWYLVLQIFSESIPKTRHFRIVSVLLAFLSPVVLTQIGSSFIDLSTSIPVVLGVATFLHAYRSDSLRSKLLIVSGLLFGAATGLKLTNAPFAISACLTVTLICLTQKNIFRIKHVFVFCMAVVSGFAAVYGYWGTALWRAFGNPFFPGFNALFESPYFPIFEIRHWRFLPQTILDAVLLPLYMLDPVSNIHTETYAPDARFLYVFLLLVPLLTVLRKNPPARLGTGLPLIFFFILSWAIWLATSGNGRYMIPLSIIVGPLAVFQFAHLMVGYRTAILIGTTIFCCIQAASLSLGATYRWGESPWQSHWISTDVPTELLEKPATIVTLGLQSTSWLAPFIHPDSRILNPIGQVTIPALNNGGQRIAKILSESKKIIVALPFSMLELSTGMPSHERIISSETAATLYGLYIKPSTCKSAYLKEPYGVRYSISPVHSNAIREYGAVTGWFFCEAELAYIEQDSHSSDAIFDFIEDRCEQLFSPRRVQTICEPKGCLRRYVNSDNNLNLTSDGSIIYSAFKSQTYRKIGSFHDGKVSLLEANCLLSEDRRFP